MQGDEAEHTDHEPVVARARLPDWPRLMPLALASAYFGVCASTFRRLDIEPRRIGRRVLWDRRDLDSYADQISDPPIVPSNGTPLISEVERRFLKRLKDNGNQGRRKG